MNHKTPKSSSSAAEASGIALEFTTPTGRSPVAEYIGDLKRGDKKTAVAMEEDLKTIHNEGRIYSDDRNKIPGLNASNVKPVHNNRNNLNISELVYQQGAGHRVYVMEHKGHVVILDAAPKGKNQPHDILSAADKARDWAKRYEKGEFKTTITEERERLAARKHVAEHEQHAEHKSEEAPHKQKPHKESSKILNFGKRGGKLVNMLTMAVLAWEFASSLVASKPAEAAPAVPTMQIEQSRTEVASPMSPIRAFNALAPDKVGTSLLNHTTPPLMPKGQTMRQEPQ